MGIRNYLKRVSKANKDIKTAITEKGVPVEPCDGIESLAEKVRAIPTGTDNGNIIYTILAFKQSETIPTTPVGGNISGTGITYPEGWSDGTGLTENVWLSHAMIKADGEIYADWVMPIKIEGNTSEGSSVDLTNYATKVWVTEQINSALQPGGTLDLSKYATKEYVDNEIAKLPGVGRTFVKSINDLTGDVTLAGSSSVSISKSGNTLTFTSTGGQGGGGTTYRTFRIYQLSNSDTVAPEISNDPAPKWDMANNTLTNIPSGWALSVSPNNDTKFVWMTTGTFSSELDGGQVGDWEGPYCLNRAGEPGNPGQDGKYFYEVYYLTNDSDTPTINELETDSNGHTRNDDNFLPKFVFVSGSYEAVGTKQSVTSENRFLWGSSRYGSPGNWGSFCSPYLVSSFVKAGLTEEEKDQIKADVSKDLTSEINKAEQRVTAIETRVDKIDGPDATFFVDKQNALVQATTQWSEENKKSFADFVVDAKKSDIELWAGQIVTKKTDNATFAEKVITDAGLDLDGAKASSKNWTTYSTKTDEAETRLNTAESRLAATEATLTNVATYTGFDTDPDTSVSTKISNMAKQTLNAAKTEINSTTATGIWIWALLDNAEDQVANFDDPTSTYNLKGNVLATKPYDTRKFLTWIDADGNKHEPEYTPDYNPTTGELIKTGEAKYRKAIEGQEDAIDGKTGKWHRIIRAAALSRIIQQPGKITLEALAEAGKNSDGSTKNNLASIILNANTPNAEINFNADLFTFAKGSEILADNLTLTNLKVSGGSTAGTYGAAINNATIRTCKITECEIESTIQNTGYTESSENGFYFNANGNFRIASKTATGEKFELTQNSITVPSAAITGKLTADKIEASDLKVAAANITGTLRADKIEAGILDCDKFSIKNLTWDKLTIEADKLKAAIADIGALTAGTVSTKNPDNTGTVEIEKNYIVLTDKNNNAALNVTGDDFAVIAAPIQQELIFTGGAQRSAIDISNELNSVGYKELKFSGETDAVIFNNAGGLPIRLNSVGFNIIPNISAIGDTQDFDFSMLRGKYDITISLYANNKKVGSKLITKQCRQNSGNKLWVFGNYNSDGNFVEDHSNTITFDSSLIPASSETNVSIKFKIDVISEWTKYNTETLQEFINSISVVSAREKVIAQTVGSAKGVVIGANGFRAALDGENYAQFSTSSTGEMEFLIQAGGTSGYGINVKKDGIQMKLAGVWYAVTRRSDGNLQLN